MIDNHRLTSYALSLSAVRGIGPRNLLKITESFPNPDALEAAERSALEAFLGNSLAMVVLQEVQPKLKGLLTRAEDDVDRHRKAGIAIIPITDIAYPPLLKKIVDPPSALYVKGSLSALASCDCVAVIGTRNPTHSGRTIAERVAGTFAEYGYVIVSGLAKGIDSHAHRGCLAHRGTTIAVLAGPLDVVYPSENRSLADEIIDAHGALISECPLGSLTHRSSFVQRDRIQSGLSLAVVPIQTDIEGGTMHTVRFAERDQRLLLCPRPIDSERREKQWAGILQLIEFKRALQFDRAEYSDVLSKIRSYREYLTGEACPPEGIPKGLQVCSPQAQMFDDEAPAPAKDEDHSNQDLVKELAERCRVNNLDRKQFNTLVADLRNALFPKKSRRKKSDTLKPQPGQGS